jgi:hypothetical protein
MSTTELTPAQAIAQQAAELLWAAATSEDHGVAWSRSPVYQAAEQAFMSAAKLAYGLTGPEADATRELLSEYGPHDALQGTTGRGIYSYVQAAHQQVNEARAESAAGAVHVSHPATDAETWGQWVAVKAGADVTVVDLADSQVGPWLRALGLGWTARPASGTIYPEHCASCGADLSDPGVAVRHECGWAADDAQLARIESAACDR